MLGGATILSSVMLMIVQAPATGIGSVPRGPGSPPDMPVSLGGDAPGTPGAASRNPNFLKVTPELAEAYRIRVAAQRDEAETPAVAARERQLSADEAAAIRAALQTDIQTWRDSFKVGSKEWKAHVGQWLVDVGSLTTTQWAERRAAWFTTRDQWIASKLGR